MRILIAIILICIAWIRTDFSPDKIAHKFVASNCISKGYDVSIFSQPFHYLSKGRQSFVFESADQKWVIKFFNASYLDMPWYGFLFPKEAEKRARRTFFYENSYSIAAQEMGDGIVYLHLRGTDPSLPSIQVFDRIGRAFTISLKDTPFVLQRKARSFYGELESMYEQEGLIALCREIDRFVSLIKVRIDKGIADGDSDVEHNWGYVDGHIVHIDPGRLYYDPTLSHRERAEIEWKRATRKWGKWLVQLCPDAASYLESKQYARND